MAGSPTYTANASLDSTFGDNTTLVGTVSTVDPDVSPGSIIIDGTDASGVDSGDNIILTQRLYIQEGGQIDNYQSIEYGSGEDCRPKSRSKIKSWLWGPPASHTYPLLRQQAGPSQAPDRSWGQRA